jgi:hypothetical protein
MRILIVCHYFAPEVGAPQARLLEMGRAWTRAGHEVTVLTGFPNHPTGVVPPRYRGRLRFKESIDGMRVIRTWLYATPNEGVLRKTLGHLSFMVSSVVLGSTSVGRPDVVVVSSPTFFSVFSAYLIARSKRARFVFEVRDLWPAVFVDLGVLKNPLVIRLLERMELAMYRAADLVVPVTDGFRRAIVDRGVESAKVVTVTNGVDLEQFVPSSSREFAREHGIDDRFIVLYLGAHGISHGLDAVLEAAALIQEADRAGRSSHPATFVFVGEGARKSGLVARASAMGLENVLFLPAQPKGSVPAIYASADVCLVPLRDVPLFDTFIPSKMFEIMGAGRPIIGAVRGEARDILERSGGAVLVEPEDPGGIAGAVKDLMGDAARRAEMGAAGRRFVETHYSRELLAQRYAARLALIVAAGEAPMRDRDV